MQRAAKYNTSTYYIFSDFRVFLSFLYRLIFNILIFKWSSLFMHIFVALVMKNFNRHCLNSGNFLWKRRRVIIK